MFVITFFYFATTITFKQSVTKKYKFDIHNNKIQISNGDFQSRFFYFVSFFYLVTFWFCRKHTIF